MAKPARGRPASRSGSDSLSSSRSRSPRSRSVSRSRSRSYSGSSSRSRSRSRSFSSSSSRSGSSRSPRRAPPRKSSADGGKRGRSPPPQTKRTSPTPRKASPIPESLVLHVDQLSRNVNENHLKEIFGNFGEVVNVRMAIDNIVNIPRGFAYVEFKNRADAESSAAYFSWPCRIKDDAEERGNYFANLQKGVLPETLGHLPEGQRANTLLELMTIRAFHSKILRCYSLGTAIGFRIRRGLLTDIPAILVFVSRKVHKQWLTPIQCLPTALEGPGGVWCDVDVVEFSYFGAPEPTTPKEQLYTEIVDDLRGSDPCIGSGSQVANQETYGTLGAIVRSQTGNRQIGFLTNRHVAVDLDYPNQKMFHPLPPTLGPGVYLGAVERATSFIRDDLWFGIFAGINPETFVRADGAFIPFTEDFDMTAVTTSVKGIGDIGNVKTIDLQSSIDTLIGKHVMKVGRSSGFTTGTVLAYALEYNDEKGICFLTDFLVVGENQQTFDLEGDSGSLIILKGENGEKPRPIGIIWGGTANRGRLKLNVGQPPENWTSGVDLGRLLNFLELDLITSDEALRVAVQEHRAASMTLVGSSAGDSSPPDVMLPKDKSEPLGLHIQHISPEDGAGGPDINSSPAEGPFDLEDGVNTGPNLEEHQFIPSFNGKPIKHPQEEDKLESRENLSVLRNNCEEDLSFSLQLGENDPKRRKFGP